MKRCFMFDITKAAAIGAYATAMPPLSDFKEKKMRKIFVVFAVIVTFVFMGCGDFVEEEEEEKYKETTLTIYNQSMYTLYDVRWHSWYCSDLARGENYFVQLFYGEADGWGTEKYIGVPSYISIVIFSDSRSIARFPEPISLEKGEKKTIIVLDTTLVVVDGKTITLGELFNGNSGD